MPSSLNFRSRQTASGVSEPVTDGIAIRSCRMLSAVTLVTLIGKRLAAKVYCFCHGGLGGFVVEGTEATFTTGDTEDTEVFTEDVLTIELLASALFYKVLCAVLCALCVPCGESLRALHNETSETSLQ